MEAIQLQICKCEWFLCDNINNDNVHNGGGGRSEHTKDQVTSDVEKKPQKLKFNGMKMCVF